MIIEHRDSQCGKYASPERICLESVYVLNRSRLPLSYESYNVKATFTLQHNHFRPHFELMLKALPRPEENSTDFGLHGLKISVTQEQLEDRNAQKEIRIMFTKGTVMTGSSKPKPDDAAKCSSKVKRFFDNLPDATTSLISSMSTPTVLRFAGGKNDILIVNLALNCPLWAEQIRNMVFKNGSIVVLVDIGTVGPALDRLKKHIQQSDPLAKFCPTGMERSDRYDLSRFVANPLTSSLLGFCASPVFKDETEYAITGLAQVELDRAPEVKKIKALEDSIKTLVLADFEGGASGREFEGLFRKPKRKEYPLQPGECFEIQFGIGGWNSQKLSWRVTVMHTGLLEKRGMLPVIVHRGRHRNSNEYCDYRPQVIDATKLTIEQLQQQVLQDRGNNVRVRLVDCERAYQNVRSAYTISSYNHRLREILLAQRLDLLDTMDLYQHIKIHVPNPQQYMMPLNGRQLEVVKAARSILAGVLIVQGPPGTGKTYILVQLAAPFLAAGKKTTILVVAPTNAGANDLAQGLCETLDILKERFPEVKIRRYVLRVYPDKTEDDISRTQGSPYPISVPDISTTQKGALSSGHADLHRKIFDDFRAADKPKFHGVRDKRVANITCSVGHMMLLISGVIPSSEYAYSDTTCFACFRTLYEKQSRGEKLLDREEKEWARQSAVLRGIAVRGASAIVSTTATISTPGLLDLVKDQVAAVFFDESAFEREDKLLPLLKAPFSLNPCFVMIGDQQQLKPLTMASINDNPFQPQLEMSFMARMIAIGMDYTMLTEQHRMVEQISEIANALTYKGQLTNDPCTELSKRPLARKFRKYTEQHYGHATNRLIVDLPPSDTNTVTRNVKSSKANDFSLCYVAGLIPSLLETFGSDASIAVLTPYSGQRFRYRRMEARMREAKLQNFDQVTIETLDGARGRQFDIVILDLVVGKSAGFLESANRLNVAVTRAKDGLIIVCSREAIAKAYYKHKEFATPYLQELTHFFRNDTWTREHSDEFPPTEYYTPVQTESTWHRDDPHSSYLDDSE